MLHSYQDGLQEGRMLPFSSILLSGVSQWQVLNTFNVRYSRLSYFQKLDFSTLPISLVILVWFHWTCSVRFHLQAYVMTGWYGRPQITTLSTLTISWNAASRAPVTNLSTVGFLFRGPEWFWATCIVCGPVSSWIFSSLANLISCMTSHIRFWNKYDHENIKQLHTSNLLIHLIIQASYCYFSVPQH